MKGEERYLNEEDARMIASYFPGARVEFVLGYDDFVTESDKFDATISEIQDESHLCVYKTILNLDRKFDIIISQTIRVIICQTLFPQILVRVVYTMTVFVISAPQMKRLFSGSCARTIMEKR